MERYQTDIREDEFTILDIRRVLPNFNPQPPSNPTLAQHFHTTNLFNEIADPIDEIEFQR